MSEFKIESAEDFEELLKAFGANSTGSIADQAKAVLPFALAEADGFIEIADELFAKYGPKLSEYLEVLRKTSVESDIKTLKQLQTDGGLTREEALQVLIVRKQTMSSAIRNSFNK